jgi:tetratricopeptide (TPR) repeat protein
MLCMVLLWLPGVGFGAPTQSPVPPPDLFSRLHLSEVDLDRFEAAIRGQIRAALERAKHDPTAETVGTLGLVLHAYEQYDRAAACYERARAIEPAAFQWSYYLGLAQADAGRADAATAALREALRLAPADVPSRLKLADVLFDRGDTEESRALYAAVIADRPASALAHYGLGRALAARGDGAGAVKSYSRAVELAPQFGAAHYALAMAYRILGDRERAEGHLARHREYQGRRPLFDDPLRERIEAQKTGPYHHLERGRQLNASGRRDEAIKAFEQALALAPDLVHAHVNMVAAYTANGAFDKAAEHYQRALALAPKQPENHYNYGLLLLAQNRELEAIEAFRTALASDPSYVDAHNNLGYLLARAGRTEEAIRELRAALQGNPAHRDAHFNLARALQASDQRDEAVEHFLAATRIEDDKTPLYLYYLADAYARQGALPEAERYAKAARARAASFGQTSLIKRIDEDLHRLKTAGGRSDRM